MFLRLMFILTYSIFSLDSEADQSFEQWKANYLKRAAAKGLSSSFVAPLLKNLEVDSVVIEKDRNQVILDKNRDYGAFIQRWLRDDKRRIAQGKELLKKHRTLLQKIENHYGVEKEIIVSLWGVETFYGEITGNYDVLRSLATLAFEGRRARFFETQLNAALRLIKNQHVTRENLKGSWAGATGQCQFMPSNIRPYAQDFNKDGKKDIWNDLEDVFASIAFFLKKAGWKKGKSIGSLAFETEGALSNPDRYRSKNEYYKLGLRSIKGGKLEERWSKRKAARIPLKNSPVVLRGSNYKPLLRWNNSSLFAAFNIILVNELKAGT